MIAMSESRQGEVDYNRDAEDYARHRNVHPGVVDELIATGRINAQTRLLDVGCGTGNYARALTAATGCQVSGIEPSASMLAHAASATEWQLLVQGSAEWLPFPDRAFDLVISTDVIHHIGDRAGYFAEAVRVLAAGGRIATVTDSHDDIKRRRPLSSHFPETIAVELRRYPTISLLTEELSHAGFEDVSLAQAARNYPLSDIQPFRNRAFSSLHAIDEEAFKRGIMRMEADLAIGPIPSLSLYTIVWGSLP